MNRSRNSPGDVVDFLTGGGEVGALMRANDWSASPLGPPGSWPQSLRSVVGLMLSSKFPMFVAWGPELGFLYNDPYTDVLGAKHPKALGRPFHDIWAEIWPDISPLIDAAMAGEATYHEDLPLLMNRRGFDEQTWFTFSYSPVRDESGRIAGLYCACTETTAKVLAEQERARSETNLREAAAELEAVLDAVPAAIWIARDPLAHRIDGNAVARRLLRTPEGRNLSVTPADPDEAPPGFRVLDAQGVGIPFEDLPVQRAARGEEVRNFEEEIVFDDGDRVFLIGNASPLRDETGSPRGSVASFVDITELKRWETALRESEARFRNMADHAPVMTWVTDAAGHCTYLNRPWYVFTGQSGAQSEGFGWLDAVHPDDSGRAGEIFLAANDRREPFRLEYRLRRADGVYRWAIDAASPRFGAAGEFLGYVGSVIDIDDRRAMESALRESEERLQFLSGLDEALTASWDAPEAMVTAAERLALRLDASRCAYADVDADADRFFIRNDYSAPGVASSIGTYSLDLFGPRAAADMRRGRTLVVRDVAGELPPGEGREMFLSIGIGAIVCCPLVKDGRLVAMMAVHQDAPRDWRADEVALVETVVERCWVHVERVGAQARLRESEARYRTLFESIESGFCVVEVAHDAGGGPVDYRVVEANPAFYRQTGFPVGILNEWLREAAPALEEHWYEAYGRVARTGEPERFEQGSDLLGRWFDVYAFPIGAPEDRRVAILFNDISARREAEERLQELNETLESRVLERTAELEMAQEALRQSQKMEAMGSLTGGVAHDFNNLLTPIVGALDRLQRQGVGNERERRLIAGAAQSADRAKTLVQRLLAFARRQPLQPVSVNVARLVTGMAALVSSTTGPQIRVVVEAADDLPPATADPNQLEMALLNLSVNARDAMPDGGTLRITASAETIDRREPAGLRPGPYVKLSVADTGVGMDEATVARAVEPFFSTKGVGRGTGLGLSMVHGLASQLGGALVIRSRPGLGTNIELWLPQSAAAPEDVAPAREPEDAPAAHGIALLVDDEALVRASTADMLADLGYAVVEAESAEAALEMVRGGLKPTLLVTDHLMPGMTGTDLARTLRETNPALQVLVVSGYAENEGIAPDLPRLGKPFVSAELAASLAAIGA